MREDAVALVRAIEALTKSSRHDDERVHDDIVQLIELLRQAPAAQRAREKVASIATWVDILFSDEKRQIYGGDREVTDLLLHDCELLRAAIRGD